MWSSGSVSSANSSFKSSSESWAVESERSEEADDDKESVLDKEDDDEERSDDIEASDSSSNSDWSVLSISISSSQSNSQSNSYPKFFASCSNSRSYNRRNTALSDSLGIEHSLDAFPVVQGLISLVRVAFEGFRFEFSCGEKVICTG